MLKMMFLKLIVVVSVATVGTAGQELLLFNMVHRHGERTPVVFYPTDPHQHDYWPRAEGQLTNKGKQQEYELGKFIKKRHNEFIGPRYFANITRYRSTDVDRTLMSAQLVSAGMYTPQGDDVWNDQLPWQPIPIHTVKLENDHLLTRRSSCPKYDRLFDEATKVPPLSDLSEKYSSVFEIMSKHAGYNVTLYNFWEIYDDVSKELARNMSEPKWIMEIWDKVVTVTGIDFGLLAPSRQMQRLKAGSFLKELIDHCKLKAANNLTYNLFLYSAHDTTLAMFLEALRVYNGIQPPYAAAILIEFYHIGQSKLKYEDYAIKFMYRNDSSRDPIPLVLPGCSNVMCPFNTFLDVVDDIIPGNIEEECRLSSPPSIADQRNLLSIIISCFILFEVVGGVIVYLVYKSRKAKPGFMPLINETR